MTTLAIILVSIFLLFSRTGNFILLLLLALFGYGVYHLSTTPPTPAPAPYVAPAAQVVATPFIQAQPGYAPRAELVAPPVDHYCSH